MPHGICSALTQNDADHQPHKRRPAAFPHPLVQAHRGDVQHGRRPDCWQGWAADPHRRHRWGGLGKLSPRCVLAPAAPAEHGIGPVQHVTLLCRRTDPSHASICHSAVSILLVVNGPCQLTLHRVKPQHTWDAEVRCFAEVLSLLRQVHHQRLWTAAAAGLGRTVTLRRRPPRLRADRDRCRPCRRLHDAHWWPVACHRAGVCCCSRKGDHFSA